MNAILISLLPVLVPELLRPLFRHILVTLMFQRCPLLMMKPLRLSLMHPTAFLPCLLACVSGSTTILGSFLVSFVMKGTVPKLKSLALSIRLPNCLANS